MANVDLYDSSYGHYGLTAYGEIRRETYGQDYGQTSWVTTAESHEIPALLHLSNKSSVLEIGCGSGGYAVHLAKHVGCQILGLDINAEGVRTANLLAEQAHVAERAEFLQFDVSQPLPEKDDAFDAVYSNDVLCHVDGRAQVFANVFRVLKPGGRFLFSDALVIGGLVSHQEIATRSSIGMYFFSPPGENERLIEQAGFRLLEARNTTLSSAVLSKRWHDARDKRKSELVAIETESNFAGLQRFLTCVHVLTSERRLLRFLYLMKKPVL
jgi:cyclopropane fatty-acyl-phospholipid synthase-like methyltransferase